MLGLDQDKILLASLSVTVGHGPIDKFIRIWQRLVAGSGEPGHLSLRNENKIRCAGAWHFLECLAPGVPQVIESSFLSYEVSVTS